MIAPDGAGVARAAAAASTNTRDATIAAVLTLFIQALLPSPPFLYKRMTAATRVQGIINSDNDMLALTSRFWPPSCSAQFVLTPRGLGPVASWRERLAGSILARRTTLAICRENAGASQQRFTFLRH